MKDVIKMSGAVLLALLFMVLVLALFYGTAGAVFYFALKGFGVGITFYQGVLLAIIIATVGSVFRGINVQGNKKEDA